MTILKEFLHDSRSPKGIPPNLFQGHLKWKRTEGSNKYHDKNPKPPSDATINKEFSDFNHFWKDYLIPKGYYRHETKAPFIIIKRGYYDDKNNLFAYDGRIRLACYLRTWSRCVENSRKELFYIYVLGEFLRILANSGMRPRAALLLRWGDITVKEREVSRWRMDSKGREKTQETQEELIVDI